MQQPLAERLRPTELENVIGQEHLTKPGTILSVALKNGRIPSMILWGPPGVGKTTIAQIISSKVGLPFFQLSAISAGVKDIRDIIETAKKATGAILFIDEIHRFNKSQQDALLAAVEKGIITLIGATTENPSFEVNAALLSRSQVFVLKALQKEQLQNLVSSAIREDSILSKIDIELEETEALIRMSGGDARKLLNLLELVVSYKQGTNEDGKIIITDESVMKAAQQKVPLYDKTGEQHYDIISAFIKSMRGSDPNGAVYWLARMIEAGEDVKFIARRMVIFASEDVGNANPNALLLATSTFTAVNLIGYPESRIILSQCVIYLATSAKSNASYEAISLAQQLVRQHGDLSVPLHLRNAPTKLMKTLDYGKDYKYAHSYENNFVPLEFLPTEIQGRTIYSPQKNAREEEARKFLKERWKEKYNY